MTDTMWIALSLVRGVGGVTMQALLARFGHVDSILGASEKELCKVTGIGKKTAQAIQNIDIKQTAEQIQRWQDAGVQITTLRDPDYPRALLTIPDAPPTLFYRAQTSLKAVNMDNAIAIVGTRSPSPQTQDIARKLGMLLSSAGYTLVSGLARGIDALVFHGASASQFPSALLGVLGSGVLNVYPSENRKLAETTVMHGALLCEVAPDATVGTPGLVARNRIISGLASQIIIVETTTEGGAMHAARAAYKQSRQIFALDIQSSGNRKLIDEGFARSIKPDLSNLSDMISGE